MLLIITGAVNPGKDAGLSEAGKAEKRLEQYCYGLEKCIRFGAFSKIVFCDNTAAGTESFEPLQKLAESLNVRLELLSFQGDSEAVARQGKGYGEGEIMEYVMAHSSLAADSEYMLKLTGRLVVDNLKQIVVELDKRKCYFNIPNRTLRNLADTRFYGMPISIFQRSFQKAYLSVDDKNGYYLEHAYTDVIRKHKIPTYNMPRYPRITGLSGSTGAVYTYTEWKCRIKDALSLVQWYRIGEGRKKEYKDGVES